MVAVSRDVLKDAIERAVANAERLLLDATILRTASSWPTARSLAVLAMEEAAKAVHWHRLAINATTESVEILRENHHARLVTQQQTWSFLDAFLDLLDDPDATTPPDEEVAERFDALAKADNADKQHGFYVDIDTDRIWDPIEQVDESSARSTIEKAGVFLGICRDVVSSAE